MGFFSGGPPKPHTHPGGDITSPVASAASALAAEAVPWTGVSGKPASFPPVAHGHGGSDIADGSLAGAKLQDEAVTLSKLKTERNVFVDLSTTAQAVNSGAAFAPGVYAFTLTSTVGAVCTFTFNVAYRNSAYEFGVVNITGGNLNVSGLPGATTFEISALFDGRTYQLVCLGNGTATLRITSGVANGQTILSFRRIV